jgi:hypothetical protein
MNNMLWSADLFLQQFTQYKKNYIILLVLGLMLFGCKHKDFVYQPYREWIFTAYFHDENKVITDSTTVKMETKGYALFSLLSGQKMLFFYYDSMKEKTGYIANEDGISLHSPRMGRFAFTEILPTPHIGFPLGSKVESEIKLEVVKCDFKELNNQTVIQTMTQKPDTEELEYAGEKIQCYKSEGHNTSHVETLGQYKVTYWFHEKFGFVRILYEKPDSSQIDIKLQKTNF